MTTKTSIGLVLCRKNPDTRVPEVLMIEQRVTYGFSEFTFGKYRACDSDHLRRMFNSMTVNEKCLIMSKDFDKMWYHIWLRLPNSHSFIQVCNTGQRASLDKFYITCRVKYNRMVDSDGGIRIRNLVNQSTSTSPGWGFPKGRRNINETEIDCAIREVKEETNIASPSYKILYHTPPFTTMYVTERPNVKTTYKSRYYTAALTSPIHIGVDFSNAEQIAEVSQMRWISMFELKSMTLQQKKLDFIARYAIKAFKADDKELW